MGLENSIYFRFILGLFGLYLRRKLEESPVYENDVATTPQRDNIGFFTIIRYYYKDILVCFVAVVFFNVTNYSVTAYLPTYLGQVVKLDETTTSVLITCVMAMMIPLALMFGKLADKVGEKSILNRYRRSYFIKYRGVQFIKY